MRYYPCMNNQSKTKGGPVPAEKASTGMRFPGPVSFALFACLMLGVGFFLGNLYFRSRSADTLVISAAPAERISIPESSLVNINTADSNELQTLPGIGPVLAQRIVAYREENGPFRYPFELADVSGIGSKTYEAVMDFITVD